MAAKFIETSLVERFRLAQAPTLEAAVSGTAPIVFSRMLSQHAQRGRSISPRAEDAFTFQVPLIRASFSELKYGSKVKPLPEIQEPGRAFLFDLSASPTVGLDTEFDNVRLYIAQRTIDDLAYEKGLRRVGGLIQSSFGERDPIMFHLAQMLVPALADPSRVSAAFVEYLALAFHEHIISTYGGVTPLAGRFVGGLAPWQIRRLFDFVEGNLASDPSISRIAAECSLSSSRFAYAFRQTMGTTPHRWLTGKRIERAKQLLRDTEETLASVAALCGFCDQSHLTRSFVRAEGCSPGKWRKLHR